MKYQIILALLFASQVSSVSLTQRYSDFENALAEDDSADKEKKQTQALMEAQKQMFK